MRLVGFLLTDLIISVTAIGETSEGVNALLVGAIGALAAAVTALWLRSERKSDQQLTFIQNEALHAIQETTSSLGSLVEALRELSAMLKERSARFDRLESKIDAVHRAVDARRRE